MLEKLIKLCDCLYYKYTVLYTDTFFKKMCQYSIKIDEQYLFECGNSIIFCGCDVKLISEI